MTVDGKRLTVFIYDFAGGGAQRTTLTLAHAFAARGHQVDLVVVRAQGPFLRELSPLVKPEQIGGLLHQNIDALEEEGEGPVHVLQLIGDSLPGIGIIAAVLGIINTMAAIAEGPEAVGEKVSAALTGTFLGILAAYGFINPLTARIKHNNQIEIQYFHGISKGLSAFTGGMAPMMAVEMARRCFDAAVQPNADDMEAAIKAMPPSK